jgi:hypothetical protein
MFNCENLEIETGLSSIFHREARELIPFEVADDVTRRESR